jgi:hypothetical protein
MTAEMASEIMQTSEGSAATPVDADVWLVRILLGGDVSVRYAAGVVIRQICSNSLNIFTCRERTLSVWRQDAMDAARRQVNATYMW